MVPLLEFELVLILVLAFFSVPPNEFAKFVKTDARDSARSTALRTAILLIDVGLNFVDPNQVFL